jgi:hypothetical protein
MVILQAGKLLNTPGTVRRLKFLRLHHRTSLQPTEIRPNLAGAMSDYGTTTNGERRICL